MEAAKEKMQEYEETFESFPSKHPNFSIYFDIERHVFYLLNEDGFEAEVELDGGMFNATLANGKRFEEGYFFIVAYAAYVAWGDTQL